MPYPDKFPFRCLSGSKVEAGLLTSVFNCQLELAVFLLLGESFSRTSVTNYARLLISLSLAVHFGHFAWHFKTTLWHFWGDEEVTLESSIHYSSTDSAATAQSPQNVWITNEWRLSGVAGREGYGNVRCPQRVALRKGDASIALIPLLLLHFRLILNFHYSPKKAKPSLLFSPITVWHWCAPPP